MNHFYSSTQIAVECGIHRVGVTTPKVGRTVEALAAGSTDRLAVDRTVDRSGKLTGYINNPQSVG